MKKLGTLFIAFTIVTALSLCAYAVWYMENPNERTIQLKETEVVVEETADTGFISATPGTYDSMDSDAVVVAVNDEEKTVTLRNHTTGSNYTLDYSYAKKIQDRYGSAISMAQIKCGDIVEVTFLRNKKRLNTISVSEKSWDVKETSVFDINVNTRVMTVGEDSCRVSEDTLVFSQGRKIELMDINDVDVITVNGIDQTIYSIVVEKGHGYVRLKNDEYFIGGWLEIGDSLIVPITEDMLLTVPEGNHQVFVTNNGNNGLKNIQLARNSEVEIDLGDIEIEEAKIGRVLFSVTPSNATVYVDGEKVDLAKPLELYYGIHQMIVKASGYETMTRYIKVGKELANIEIRLDKIVTVSGNEVSTETAETAETKETTPSTEVMETEMEGVYKIHIEGPAGVEVYMDNNYIGIAPVDCNKTPGSHVITLRKEGFVTRSYTVEIDTEEKDISYSFAELVAEQ